MHCTRSINTSKIFPSKFNNTLIYIEETTHNYCSGAIFLSTYNSFHLDRQVDGLFFYLHYIVLIVKQNTSENKEIKYFLLRNTFS